MRLRLGIAVPFAVLAACGSSVASPGTTSARRHCGPAGANALASSSQARVYSWHGGVFGCSFAHGRSFRLGTTAHSIRESRVDPIAVAGADAAYGLTSFGVDTVTAEVVVRRLTDGRQGVAFPATRAVGPEGVQSVASLVVKSDGAVAWIGAARSVVGGRQFIEVHAAAGSASPASVLDSGPQVVAGSLRLHGSTLTWMHGQATRSATLQ